jgi:tRNA(Ile)-lysidine synthase
VPGFAISIVRPLLDVSRGDLRAFLGTRGLSWTEDPMNEDPRFARVRLRRLWPQLEEAGLAPPRIADAARHLARARQALEEMTADFLAANVRFEADRALVNGAAFSGHTREIGLRALAALLGRISGAPYRPRFERLERLYEGILGGNVDNGRTLLGCRVGRAPKREALFGRSTLVVAPEASTSPRNRPKRVDNDVLAPHIQD